MEPKLLELLFPDDNLRTYGVIDGASCDELLPRLNEFSPDYYCLYAGELEPDIEECAPYLVCLDPGHPFTEWLLSEFAGKNWGIFARSPAELRELRKHFRKFMLVKDPEGKTLYFRYYDPRVLRVYLPTTNEQERETVFGPVKNFFCESENGQILVFEASSAQALSR